MRDYFRARIAEEQRELRNRAGFRQKFYTPDCFFDSRAGTIKMIESEQVISSTANGETEDVITVITNPLVKGSGPRKQRYLLIKSGDAWLIREGQLACHSCDGKPGNEGCMLCHGKGWLSFHFNKRGD